jgi:hypothetical protein
MTKNPNLQTNYRFTGHGTFPCRYTWLPKAVRHLSDETLFQNEDEAMVSLGVGKNMVRAIRFWADVVGVSADAGNGRSTVSPFGLQLLGEKSGFDPYLEDLKTLWLIHWKMSTSSEPLFGWEYLLNSWHRSDFTRSEVVEFFADEANRLGKKLSRVTLDNHFTTFLHTYVPTRSQKGEVLEDNLDCPLIELDFLIKVGERAVAESNYRESIYSFRNEEKPEISGELFAYCLNDFWTKHRSNESTLTFRDICVGRSSPGVVLKLPEQAIRARLETLEKDSHGSFSFEESAALQQVTRRKETSAAKLLARIYQ